ncbi:hypothetical protein [Paraburkholderia unamae]|uniref:Uncharacterized protein n=1 Tax=Paraburkholderia unamae TaxID=219649 RepID=A0ABX5KVL5_9BURK|nr:hypothetical protein [Paraburkholderia unamae]PVX85477.1 hypothetical protein C7402_10345 [Paraburkholderia unamae]RAR55312.1 hypothetical protein C7401_12296 [Paraburkholderia unamae]CAG9267874.1 conserved hypothetical protein [Paraburkholderia unamae]
MSLSEEQVRAIADAIRTAPTLPDAAARWRERFPGVRTMRISASEMHDETPALQFGERRVYYARLDGMCVSVTGQADEAEMLIFTEGGASDGDR